MSQRERSVPPRPAPARPARPRVAWPWLDHRGRVSPLKSAVLLAVLLPGLIVAAQWALGDLGPRPRTEAIHTTGLWAIRLLLITLAITPLRRVADWRQAPLLRRMLGLSALCYALAHLGLYVADEAFDLPTVAREIALRIYLTIGFAALVGLCVLGWTSTDAAIRRMGKRWKRLHRIVYGIGVLAALHFYMQSKANVSEAVFVSGLFLWLMFWRALPTPWQARVPALLALAPLAAAATALAEFAWYGLATRVPPMRVLLANLDLDWDAGLRPAVWVLIVALAMALLPAVRGIGARLARRRTHASPRTTRATTQGTTQGTAM